jgi:hypothetical protein
MGGTVGFRSVFLEGSEFWVDMPVFARAKRASAESGVRRVFKPGER